MACDVPDRPIKWHDTGKYKMRRLVTLLFTKSDDYITSAIYIYYPF